MSLCHSKHHVSTVLWNILRSSDSRRFTEIKSSMKILAHFLIYYSCTLHMLPHPAWGQNAIRSTYLNIRSYVRHTFTRPETSVQLPLAWKLGCFSLVSTVIHLPASVFRLYIQFSSFVGTLINSLVLLQHIIDEGPNTKLSEYIFPVSRKI